MCKMPGLPSPTPHVLKRFWPLLLALCLGTATARAQVHVPAQDSIDVLETDLSLAIDTNSNHEIAGAAKITWQSALSPSRMGLHLKGLTVDSVFVNNQAAAFARVGEVLYVYFASPPAPNPVHTTRIVYHGAPVTDATWGGFYFQGGYAYNMGVGFASTPHCFGRVWFPCEDNFDERCTFRFHIITDATRMAVCNGLQTPGVPLPPSFAVWHWQQNQPIPSYLACVAIGPYAPLQDTLHSRNGAVVPVLLATAPADTADMRASFAHLPQAFHAFEQRFGAYAFSKVGYSVTPFAAGAMEHASNITYPMFAVDGTRAQETLFAHELSHHWFGDLATCATAADMWLNEGWATYCEKIFLEHTYDRAAYDSAMAANHLQVLRQAHRDDGAVLPVSGVPSPQTYGTTVYKKGCDVAHTLRGAFGNDTAFFGHMQRYLAHHHLDTASTGGLAKALQNNGPNDMAALLGDFALQPGWATFAIDTFEERQNGGVAPHVLRVAFREKDRWARHSFTAPYTMPMGAWLADGTYQEFAMPVRNGHADYPLGTPAVLLAALALDPHNAFALARSGKLIHATHTGTYNAWEALAQLDITTLADSAVVHISCEFVPADWWKTPPARPAKLNQQRHWRVATVLPAGCTGLLTFKYDARFGQGLEDSLRAPAEDSIRLFFRPSPGAEWREAQATYAMGNPFDRLGQATAPLAPGEYAWGSYGLAATVEASPASTAIRVLPNPSNGTLTVELNAPLHRATLHLIDVAGKQVPAHIEELDGGRRFAIATYAPPGTYLLTVAPHGASRPTFQAQVVVVQ